MHISPNIGKSPQALQFWPKLTQRSPQWGLSIRHLSCIALDYSTTAESVSERATSRINHSSPTPQTQEMSLCSAQADVATAGVTGHLRTGWSRSNRLEALSTDPWTWTRGSNPIIKRDSDCHSLSDPVLPLISVSLSSSTRLHHTPGKDAYLNSGTISLHAKILSPLWLAHLKYKTLSFRVTTDG